MKWKEWHYQFEVAMCTYDLRTAQVMEAAQKMEIQDVTTERVRA